MMQRSNTGFVSIDTYSPVTLLHDTTAEVVAVVKNIENRKNKEVLRTHLRHQLKDTEPPQPGQKTGSNSERATGATFYFA
jgi:hypothetical protein